MQTKTGILFLQREKFQVYSPYLPNLFEFRFVPELIQDFDVVNRELLENLLKVFLTNNKIPASGLAIVISENASFIKDFVLPSAQPAVNPQQASVPPRTLADLQEAANAYLQLVPFDSVASRTFPLANGVRAYATNQDMYEVLKTILEKLGFIIQGVFPAFIFDQQLSAKGSLDSVSINLILQKIPTLREYNLMRDDTSDRAIVEPEAEPIEEKEEVTEVSPAAGGDEKNKTVMLAVIISVIVLIVIVTGIVLYYQFTTPPYKPPPPPTPQVTSQQTVQPTQAVTVAPIDDLTSQVIFASSSATQANQVKTKLSLYGFKTLVLESQENVTSAQTLLVFSPRVDLQTKESVTKDVKGILKDVIIQEKPDTVNDITVILAK